jgi:hypothetical protein
VAEVAWGSNDALPDVAAVRRDVAHFVEELEPAQIGRAQVVWVPGPLARSAAACRMTLAMRSSAAS